MTDARTDFFSTGATAKKKPTRDDFFSGAQVDADMADEKPKAKEPGVLERFKRLAFSTPESMLAENQSVEDVARAGVGAGEAAAQQATNVPASLAGGVNMSASLLAGRGPQDALHRFEQTRSALTYDPRTAEGMNAAENVGAAMNNLGPNQIKAGADFLFEKTDSPLAGAAAETLGNAALMAAPAGLLKAKPMAAIEAKPKISPVESAQAKLNQAASGQSMGAAAAAPDIKSLSPDLQQAVVKATQETGGAVNPDALIRHVQADSLPVKVQLSKGQALGDERLISIEMNARGKHEEFSKGFRAQNEALTENLKAMRDETGPDVFSTNHVEHADTLIARYQAIDDARNQQIGANYQALRDAAGGEFPVDAKALLANSQKALKAELKQHDAPPSVMRTLEELAATDTMTFEQFEHLRTNLANIQRQNPDGNVRHAAGLIRKEMESLPLKGGAADLKPLADAARASAKERFDALKADPAYKAAVEGAQPDKFVQKYVIGGNRDQVALLAKAMEGDAAAQQTLKVATLDHLRQAAGVDPGYNGNFTQAGYNKALRQLEPKLGSLLDAKTADTARTLGDVARYTQFQPKGSFVNNSNTFVSAAAEKAADALEGAINYKAGGIPVASYVRKTMNDNKLRKQAAETFAPGAGLTKLSDLAKVGKEKK